MWLSPKRLAVLILIALHSAEIVNAAQMACQTSVGANAVNPCMASDTCTATCAGPLVATTANAANGECPTPAGANHMCANVGNGLTFMCVGTSLAGACLDKSDRCTAACTPGMECVGGLCVTPLAPAMCAGGESFSRMRCRQ